MKGSRFLWGVVLALVIAAGSHGQGTVAGRDMVKWTNTGGVLTNSGAEDLLAGFGAHRYPWLTTARTLMVATNSAADTGWVVLVGLNNQKNAIRDSVWVAGVTPKLYSSAIYRVNSLAFKASAVNVGEIRAYVTSYDDTTGILGVILPGASVSSMGIYSFPVNRKPVETRGFRVVFSQGQTAGAGGAAGVLIRRPNNNWEVLHEAIFTKDAGPIDLPFPIELVDPTPALDIADVCIRVAPTNAAIDARAEWRWIFSERQ